MATPWQLRLFPVPKKILFISNFLICPLVAATPRVTSFPRALAEGNGIRGKDFLAKIREVSNLNGKFHSHEVGLEGNIHISGAGNHR